MKKVLYYSLLTVLSIMPIVISACSDDDSDDENSTANAGLKYVITSDNEVAVSGFSDSNDGVVDGRSSTSLVIPSQVTLNGKTYNVTSIAECAFEFSPRLATVTIPSSVTKIGMKAFAECSSLTDVTIPSSVVFIDSIAFMGCTKADVVVEADTDTFPSFAGTAFANVHSVKLSGNVVSSFESGKLGDYTYVDLGLPSGIKWATYNVGATSICNNGGCYSRSESETASWGESWRLPTSTELDELVDGCDWQWITNFYGIVGELGTSKTNGKQIFLPAAVQVDDELNGGYWSSTSKDYVSCMVTHTVYYVNDAYHLDFHTIYFTHFKDWTLHSECNCSIRFVSE